MLHLGNKNVTWFSFGNEDINCDIKGEGFLCI